MQSKHNDIIASPATLTRAVNAPSFDNWIGGSRAHWNKSLFLLPICCLWTEQVLSLLNEVDQCWGRFSSIPKITVVCIPELGPTGSVVFNIAIEIRTLLASE